MLRDGPLFYQGDPHRTIRDLPGVGLKLGKRIVEDLGDGDAHVALVSIERNPYTLTDVEGIGFKKADRIALQAFKVDSEDLRRHEAGNRSILEQKGVLTERELSAERARLELRNPAHIGMGTEQEEGLFWLPEQLAAERGLERWMRHLPAAPDVLPELSEVQRSICSSMGLDDVQQAAVRAGLHARVLCLTGGAGTGKTHVVAALACCVIVAGQTVRGAAFAGKAADRMREAFAQYGIQADASTIHKALGFMKKAFTVEMLAEDLVVLDESSMLPVWLLWEVVKALKPGAHLVLVGDPNQLPPIGHGTPFPDLIEYGAPRAHLSRNYRQADQQGILHMAEGVLHRSRPEEADCVEMHLGIDPVNVEPLFVALVERLGGEDFEHWQGITYTNENAERYNLAAQQVINPLGDPLFEYPLWKLGTDSRNAPLNRAEVRVGDKVLVVKNSTLLDIFNGQTGRVIGQVWKAKQVRRQSAPGVWEIVNGESMQHLRVEITGRLVDIPEDECEKYVQLGYVITVHKAQGSDWDRVIVIQPGKVRDDTARRFFYTALTRAKTHLAIVSNLRRVAWWTNASADAPEEPSSLMKRLARPEPCIWCQYEGCGVCNPAAYPAEPEPDWEALAGNVFRSEYTSDFQAAAEAICGVSETPSELLTPAPWRTLRQAAPVMHDPAPIDDEIVVPDHVPADLHAVFRSLVRAGRE
jgi:exodeoxyribonuclease V alpha subunit